MQDTLKNIENFLENEIKKEVAKRTNNVDAYKEFLEGFTETLEMMEENGRTMLKECSEDKLKFSEAEAEGFLRAVITIKNTFENDIKYIE